MNIYRCIVTSRTIYLEPTVSWSPQSHGLQRRKHYFQKQFPEKSLVWVQDKEQWETLKQNYAVTTFIVENNKLKSGE